MTELEHKLSHALIEMVLQHCYCDPKTQEYEAGFLSANQDPIHLLAEMGCMKITHGEGSRGVKATFVKWPEEDHPDTCMCVECVRVVER